MAGIARKDVEILIHTTAPSRGQDDARYRALAQAYLDFQPAKRREIGEEISHLTSERWDVELTSRPPDRLQQSAQEERDSQASFHPDHGESSEEEEPLQLVRGDMLDCSRMIDSPDLSFNSAADNADSPIFRSRITSRRDGSEAQQDRERESGDARVSPPSIIADSQPENINLMISFSSPTRMLELYLQHQESQAPGSDSGISTPERQNESSSLGLPARTRGGLSVSPEPNCSRPRSLELAAESQSGPPSSTSADDPTQSSPSVVKGRGRPRRVPEVESLKPPSTQDPAQSSPSVVKGRGRPRRVPEVDSLKPPSTQDPQLGLKRKWDSSSSGEPRHSSAPSKATGRSVRCPTPAQPLTVRPEKRRHIESLDPHVTSSSPSIPSSSTPGVRASSFGGPLVWTEKCEIRPHLPATSVGNLTPEMLLTSSLARFEKELTKVSLVPAYQSRGVRDMERGYWLVNCEGWDENHRHECWERLGNFVGSDHAGWAVWCIRDECFREIRVFCFGFVAGQVYLLLYMASLGKIKKAGLCWKGGDGETIIRMPS
ncbi:unnamed protein product [Diplocarpon coronariae]|uniref:Uncharacterized protein n=1 Tax=Diplocarpon coronariae TaxID=2795749 RepID=A0A218ZGK9_9HELO|nr:hypothetical protein B2J93_1962 [Marssonina coronariae]